MRPQYQKFDLTDAKVKFDSDGKWYDDVYRWIPLSQVALRKIWRREAFDSLMKRIQTVAHDNAHSAVPQTVFDSVYLEPRDRKYWILQGIHRTQALHQSGYTHVLALFHEERKTAPDLTGAPPHILPNLRFFNAVDDIHSVLATRSVVNPSWKVVGKVIASAQFQPNDFVAPFVVCHEEVPAMLVGSVGSKSIRFKPEEFTLEWLFESFGAEIFGRRQAN